MFGTLLVVAVLVQAPASSPADEDAPVPAPKFVEVPASDARKKAIESVIAQRRGKRARVEAERQQREKRAEEAAAFTAQIDAGQQAMRLQAAQIEN